LDAVDGSEAVIQISSERNPGVYLATHHQILAQAAPEIKLNGSTILK
jgi:hypothetical protein